MTFKSRIALSIAALLTLMPLRSSAQMADFHVVPMPQKVAGTKGGAFQLTPRTLISYTAGDKTLKRQAQMLAQYVKESTGMELRIVTLPVQRNCIRLTKALRSSNNEAYNIRVNSDIILLDGASDAGLFYAMQTLRKALPTGQCGERGITVPATEVNDAPRFAYRGAHLDIS